MIIEYVKKVFPKEWVEKWESSKIPLSRRKLDSNFVGICGECLVIKNEGGSLYEYLENRPFREADLGFDIVIGEKRYDVKTLLSICEPRKNFRYNVTETDIEKTSADGYIWVTMVTIENSPSSVPFKWGVVGWLFKEEFLEKAEYHLEGDESKTGNHFIFPCNAYDISINELKPIGEIPR